MKTRHQYVKKVFMVLPFCLFTFLPSTLNAQTFTQRIQKNAQGEGSVVIHQDKAIDDLVNKPATPNNTNKQSNSATPQNAREQQNTPTVAPADTLSTLTKEPRTYKGRGYRVQIFAGGNSRKDRQQAEATCNRVKRLYPEVLVTVHFYSPRWICQAGTFRTYEEAHEMLENVKALGYRSAIITKTKGTSR